MKRKMVFSVAVAALLLVSVLLSGCLDGIVPSSPEEKAKQLADATAEGQLATVMVDSFAKIKNCTVDELISATEAYYTKSGMDVPDITEEQKEMMGTMLEEMSRCIPTIDKSVENVSGNEYLVKYSYAEQPAGCEEMGTQQEGSFLEIKADTVTGETEVIEGAMSVSEVTQAQQMIEQLDEFGDCGIAVTLMAFMMVVPQAQQLPSV